MAARELAPWQSMDAPASLLSPERTQKFELLIHLLGNLGQPLVLSGPGGIGKTSFLHFLAANPPPNWDVCLVRPTSSLNLESLSAKLLHDFERAAGIVGNAGRWNLEHYCDEWREARKTMVLAIDNAADLLPGLADAAWQLCARHAALRLVLALDTAELLGKHKTDSAAMGRAQVIEIPPLNEAQCFEYLRALGESGEIPFCAGDVSQAMAGRVYRASDGIPGLVSQGLEREGFTPSPSLGREGLVAAIGLGLLACGAATWLWYDAQQPAAPATPAWASKQPMPAAPPAPSPPAAAPLKAEPALGQPAEAESGRQPPEPTGPAPWRTPLSSKAEPGAPAKKPAPTRERVQSPDSPLLSGPAAAAKQLVQRGEGVLSRMPRKGGSAEPTVKPGREPPVPESTASDGDSVPAKKIAEAPPKTPPKVAAEPTKPASSPAPAPEVPKSSKSPSGKPEPRRTSPSEPATTAEADLIIGTRGLDWVFSQDGDHYTLQLVAHGNPDSLKRFMAAHPELEGAATYKTWRGKKPIYPVLYGVFSSLAEAEAFASHLPPQFAKPWPRQFKAIQAELGRNLSKPAASSNANNP